MLIGPSLRFGNKTPGAQKKEETKPDQKKEWRSTPAAPVGTPKAKPAAAGPSIGLPGIEDYEASAREGVEAHAAVEPDERYQGCGCGGDVISLKRD